MIINGALKRNILKNQVLTRISILILLLFSSPFINSQTLEDEKNFQQCKACHTIGGGKLVGPDLIGISERREEVWLMKFIQNSQELIQSGDELAIQVFNENMKIPMPAHNLTDDQVRGILAYIASGGKVAGAETVVAPESTEASSTEMEAAEETVKLLAEMKRDSRRNMRSTFIIMIVLLLISLFDLVVTKLVKARWIHIIIILTSLTIVGELIFVEATSLGRQQYYQPDQPVAFSHKVHAGQNKIDCQYCHFTADKSMYAGIPPVETCMNCHAQVKKGKKTGTEEIAKIYAAIEQKKPIEWVKVHNLPDHVYFNHAQHVNVGKLECQQCHGEVEKMDEIIQVNDLSMGWCIDCHRTQSVQFANNKFYEQYTQLHQKLKNGERSAVTVLDIGGDECQKCHY
ncbi:MAG: c-type cytochrome [Bacteroidales bacterium]|nr:c-type cytochrome [Bacteroidales bacterium]